MAHTNKSPYEIRLNALELAQRTLSEQKAAESAKQHLSNNELLPAMVTSAPSVEEVIAAAEKFNNFISKPVE